jgi:protein-disulfide isomerase/uncharacterized membrane protein
VAELLALTKKIGCNRSVAKTTTTPATSSSVRTFLWAAAVSTVIALFVHGYLYSQHLALDVGQATKSVCDINETFSCSAVAASKFSTLFGIPVALWGFIANFGFLILLGLYPLTETGRESIARRNLLIVSGVIAAASIVMGGIAFTQMQQYCLFCMAAYVLSFLNFLFVWLANRKPAGTLMGAPAFHFKDLTPVLVVAAAGFLAGFVAHSSMQKSSGSQEMDLQAQGLVEEWKASPVRDVKVVDPLVKGASVETAKMTLVEFADFRCIHCKHAAPVIKAFAAAHPDVRVEFQPWPLDGECNSAINQSNGASCLLARVVWCAEKNKKTGWAAHDYIYDLPETYMSTAQIEGDYANMTRATQMSAAEMKACADSEEAKKVVRAQADAGSALQIQGTPSIYANKKQLSGGQSLPVLKRAYQSL